MNFTQTKTCLKNVRETMKSLSITYREITRRSKEIGLNKGRGYSYSYIRRVLVDETAENTEIVILAEKMIALRQKANCELAQAAIAA